LTENTTEAAGGSPLKVRLEDAFAEDLLPRRRQYDSDFFDKQLAKGQRNAYRYVLVLLAVMLAPIDAQNFYNGQYIPALAGLIVLSLLLFNIYLLTQGREAYLAPPVVLLMSIALVVLSLIYGQNYNLYWIYPLLVALPVLLKTRVSVWLGVIVGIIVTPFVFMRFETGTAIIVMLSMGHTWLISAGLMFAMTQQSRRLNEMAMTDPLTGAFNRRHMQQEARRVWQSYQKDQRTSTLLFIDVDYFKLVNDNFGHEAGDKALCGIVSLIRNRLRSEDLVFRYGGEEFVVLLRDTDESRAIHVAEEIRSFVEQTEFIPEHKITISIGVCDVLQADSVDHWLSQGDRALYQAKREGRNRVVIATPGSA
jgi:diguanylate cyclase (GGDEF)-like protein